VLWDTGGRIDEVVNLRYGDVRPHADPSVRSWRPSESRRAQPAWLAPWFNFWSQTVCANPAFFATTIGLFRKPPRL
jgi:hypothetical protein